MKDDKIKIEKVGTTSVIFVKGVKGDGTMENPVREIVQFYLPSGNFIGEIDGLTSPSSEILTASPETAFSHVDLKS